MQTEKSNQIISKDYDYEPAKVMEQKLKEDLKLEKPHQNALYKVLKYNPIDPLNDLYRNIIERLNLTDLEKRLEWRAANIWVKLAARVLWNFKAEYPKKNIFPEWGPVVLVSSHQSHLDPFFCGCAMHRRIHWMSKLENFQTPIVRTLFTNLSAFKLDRENPSLGWDTAKDLLRQGEVVGIFPEGTRSVDGELGEFKTGAVRMAIEMDCPIVPMAVIGSQNALPKGKLVMKPTQVITRVGEPIYYHDYKLDKMSYEDIRRLTNELRTVIFELKEGTYGKTEQDLSIGAPTDLETKPKFNIKRYGKDILKGTLQLIDDSWYALIEALRDLKVDWKFKETVYMFSAQVVDKWLNLMAPYKIIDFENIPNKGGFILCTNHNSEWDVIMLATLFGIHKKRYIWQMSKQSLFQYPVVNAWVRTHFAFPLRRGAHDVDSYNYAKFLLNKDQVVTIYPEGTTNTGGGELLEGHTGAMRLAIEAQVPIVLIGITGTEDTYPKHAKMLNFYKGNVFKAGPPFMEHKQYWGKTMPDYDELKRLTNNMMAQIKELLLYDEPDA
ncbi:MAG: lysophospholipid acyltransferase family protein [Promethearchaeota archaeon]